MYRIETTQDHIRMYHLDGKLITNINLKSMREKGTLHGVQYRGCTPDHVIISGIAVETVKNKLLIVIEGDHDGEVMCEHCQGAGEYETWDGCVKWCAVCGGDGRFTNVHDPRYEMHGCFDCCAAGHVIDNGVVRVCRTCDGSGSVSKRVGG